MLPVPRPSPLVTRRPRLFAAARDDTASLTEQMLKIEREIDERVAALYGLTKEEIKIAEEPAR